MVRASSLPAELDLEESGGAGRAGKRRPSSCWKAKQAGTTPSRSHGNTRVTHAARGMPSAQQPGSNKLATAGSAEEDLGKEAEVKFEMLEILT